MAIECPACNKPVRNSDINAHLDSGCEAHVVAPGSQEEDAAVVPTPSTSASDGSRPSPPQSQATSNAAGSFFSASQKRPATSFFTPAAKRHAPASSGSRSSSQQAQSQSQSQSQLQPPATPLTTSGDGNVHVNGNENGNGNRNAKATATTTMPALAGTKRKFSEDSSPMENRQAQRRAPGDAGGGGGDVAAPLVKKLKSLNTVPLAERMRPDTLDDIEGQDLVSRSGILRSLIESQANATLSSADRGLPSMILWGGSGTGKTTIARCIARYVSARFVELNATATGVAECKKLFAEAENELKLTGRRTIIFCDEIHRFSKSQQDIFLRPVEAGVITLVGATTENPSFKVQQALLSRCRTFTLQKLSEEDVVKILRRALAVERERRRRTEADGGSPGDGPGDETSDAKLSALLDDEMLRYLSAFSDGDARTALNLLEMALSLASRAGGTTKQDLKTSLTQTLVYDRAGDQHYDTISAFHKSVRGGDADATLYYLARMLQSGEDALYIARRMVVIASEDVGLADNAMLSLATATHAAVQQLGLPEARIPLAHCAVALALAPKSTRSYRGLSSAMAALKEPGVAGVPIPLHLRNAPTRLVRDLGYGAQYKYPPNYRDGRVVQTYMPEGLVGRRFLEDRDLGTEVDPDLEAEAGAAMEGLG